VFIFLVNRDINLFICVHIKSIWSRVSSDNLVMYVNLMFSRFMQRSELSTSEAICRLQQSLCCERVNELCIITDLSEIGRLHCVRGSLAVRLCVRTIMFGTKCPFDL